MNHLLSLTNEDIIHIKKKKYLDLLPDEYKYLKSLMKILYKDLAPDTNFIGLFEKLSNIDERLPLIKKEISIKQKLPENNDNSDK